jgi:hypothetical protein
MEIFHVLILKQIKEIHFTFSTKYSTKGICFSFSDIKTWIKNKAYTFKKCASTKGGGADEGGGGGGLEAATHENFIAPF